MLTRLKHCSACRVTLIFLAVGLAACSRTPSDESVAQDLQAQFYAEPLLKTASIQVAVSKGEAMLSGEVSSHAIRQKAIELAGVTPGVKKINDLMRVMAAIPAGTEMQIAMIDSIDSRSSQVGSLFRASLHVPLTAGNQVVVPSGTGVYVKLVDARSAGSIKDSSELEVILDHLELQGESIPLDSSAVQQKGASRGKQTAKRTAIVGGAGAILGGILGGGKGAAIGASVGAGGTLAYQALTKGPEIRIPSQTKLTFILAEPFQVPVQPPENQ